MAPGREEERKKRITLVEHFLFFTLSVILLNLFLQDYFTCYSVLFSFVMLPVITGLTDTVMPWASAYVIFKSIMKVTDFSSGKKKIIIIVYEKNILLHVKVIEHLSRFG